MKLALAPGLPEGVQLPRVIYLDDLEHVKLKRWMCIGNALVVTDRSDAHGQDLGLRVQCYTVIFMDVMRT